MSENAIISIKTLDAAMDQANQASALNALPVTGATGYKHGVRLLRLRIAGQFMRNQSQCITPIQLTECVTELKGEIAKQKAPSPDLISDELKRNPEYWEGYDLGVTGYQTAIERLHLPDLAPPPPTARRRTSP